MLRSENELRAEAPEQPDAKRLDKEDDSTQVYTPGSDESLENHQKQPEKITSTSEGKMPTDIEKNAEPHDQKRKRQTEPSL